MYLFAEEMHLSLPLFLGFLILHKSLFYLRKREGECKNSFLPFHFHLNPLLRLPGGGWSLLETTWQELHEMRAATILSSTGLAPDLGGEKINKWRVDELKSNRFSHLDHCSTSQHARSDKNE